MNRIPDGLEISMGDYPPAGEPFTAMVATDRQAIIELLDGCKKSGGDESYLEITMPCGYERKFSNHCDIPFEDLLCPCGNADHYLIRYTTSMSKRSRDVT